MNITLDENPNSTATKTYAAGSATETYNVSLYDVQSLSFGYHEVDVLLLDWSNGTESVLWFDYAAVNDTTPSSSPIPTPSASFSSPTRTQ
jgi:hypothetical protein